METIVGEDPSRPPWPACPSDGWISGVDRLTSLPNGLPLVPTPSNWLLERDRLRSRARDWERDDVFGSISSSDNSTCELIPNLDFDQGTEWLAGGVAYLGACCDMCAANPLCFAATFTGGPGSFICWLKNATQASKPVQAEGATGVWVNARGPSPVNPNPVGRCNTLLATESHGGYQHGDGWKTINSDGSPGLFPPNTPPALDPAYALGTACPGNFASEFGGSSMSSFESFAGTLAPEHWGLQTPPMYQRNYAAANFVSVYFGSSVDPNATGALAFQAQLFLATLGTALEMKGDIEQRRGRNSFGLLEWQLNEVVSRAQAGERALAHAGASAAMASSHYSSARPLAS